MKQQECKNRFSQGRRVFDRRLNGVKPIEESPGRSCLSCLPGESVFAGLRWLCSRRQQ